MLGIHCTAHIHSAAGVELHALGLHDPDAALDDGLSSLQLGMPRQARPRSARHKHGDGVAPDVHRHHSTPKGFTGQRRRMTATGPAGAGRGGARRGASPLAGLVLPIMACVPFSRTSTLLLFTVTAGAGGVPQQGWTDPVGEPGKRLVAAVERQS